MLLTEHPRVPLDKRHRSLPMPVLLLLILIGFFARFGDLEGVASGFEPWPSVVISGNEGVILPRGDATDLVWSEDPVDGYWLPGEEWLIRAEDAVVRESAAIADEHRKPVIEGNRQYAGFIVNSERKIHINSMCSSTGNWRSSVIVVMDGGPCYWQAVYNAETDEVESLVVNGEA